MDLNQRIIVRIQLLFQNNFLFNIHEVEYVFSLCTLFWGKCLLVLEKFISMTKYISTQILVEISRLAAAVVRPLPLPKKFSVET